MSNLNNIEIKQVYNMPPKNRKNCTLLNAFTENSFRFPRSAHPSFTPVIKRAGYNKMEGLIHQG